MKYLQITPETTLSEISDIVGERNIDYVLNANGLTRSVNIGKQLFSRDLSGSTDSQTKMAILNTLVGNSDVFEKAALGTDADWVSLYKYGTFPDCIMIPDEIAVSLSSMMYGNGEPVLDIIYDKCNTSLKEFGEIDPLIFTEYSVISANFGVSTGNGDGTTDNFSFDANGASTKNPFEWFQIPWGKISLYSSISNDKVDFPVYPEEISDGYSATYDQMPNLLYQYEPWQVYKSSGPRTNTYTFHMHRDMWTGDHRDGLANKLVRYCESNCFPDYNGSAVNAPTVTLYMNGENLITGVLNSVKVDWSGPLGLDGFYLELKLTLDITEVSKEPLNYNTVKAKGLIS